MTWGKKKTFGAYLRIQIEKQNSSQKYSAANDLLKFILEFKDFPQFQEKNVQHSRNSWEHEKTHLESIS